MPQFSADTVDTIIIGAGQAGLCASYHLSQLRIEHLILERARVGERWRSERWDSLRFQFPNRYLRLPGFAYDGDEPEAFMHRDGVVQFIERYAANIDAPLHCGVEVQHLARQADGEFVLRTSRGEYRARNVVVATGPYQKTLIPPLADQLPHAVRQLPASAYTSAQALPPGGVLVVGAGGSGVQITEDLLAAGRQTWLCVGHFRRMPRRYRGRDVMDWFEQLGLTTQPVEAPDPHDHSPLLTGIDGGYEVDLRRIVAAGGTLLGRLEGVDGDSVLLGDQLLHHMEAAEVAYDQLVQGIETALAASGETISEPPAPPPAPGPMPPEPPTQLSLVDAGITSIIWATGYGVDFSWVECGNFQEDGSPVHQQGVTEVPGLYYLGLVFLHSLRSTLFWGVGEDARFVAEHIANQG